MTKSVDPIPPGHHTVTPYLIVKGAAKAVEFYAKAFGAVPVMEPLVHPDGRIGHIELRIGDSLIMLADEFAEMDINCPEKFGGSPVSIHLYVEDVDKVASEAVAAGATIKQPVQNQFYGDRTGSLTDPFGHTWHVATHIEDLTPEELRRRAEAAMKQQSATQ